MSDNNEAQANSDDHVLAYSQCTAGTMSHELEDKQLQEYPKNNYAVDNDTDESSSDEENEGRSLVENSSNFDESIEGETILKKIQTITISEPIICEDSIKKVTFDSNEPVECQTPLPEKTVPQFKDMVSHLEMVDRTADSFLFELRLKRVSLLSQLLQTIVTETTAETIVLIAIVNNFNFMCQTNENGSCVFSHDLSSPGAIFSKLTENLKQIDFEFPAKNFNLANHVLALDTVLSEAFEEFKKHID